MKKVSAMALVALALVSGCAGTRTPKLAKCVGPYRYANPYGTVLPSLPISGQPNTGKAAPPQPPVATPGSPGTPSAPTQSPPVDPPAPAKSSAISSHYPSC